MPERRVDRDVVVGAALAVLDVTGLDRLTVRAIAARLGIQNPGLYWHFRDKQEIIDAMAERIILEAMLEPGADVSWTEWLPEVAMRFRRAMLAHRDGSRVIASADLSASSLQMSLAEAVRRLEGAGFPPRVALIGVLALFDYTLGATFEEQAEPGRVKGGTKSPTHRSRPGTTPAPLSAFIAGPFTGEDAYAGGVQLLVDGLRSQLTTRE